MPQLNERLLDQLLEVAVAAGRAIMPHYDNTEVHRKSDGSPVTAADMAADAVIDSELSHLFPDVPQVSEERIDQVQMGRLQGGDFFLIDPLDGTRLFLERNGEFTVNIALIRPSEKYPHHGRPIAGVVHAPATGESWIGAEGVGAWKITAGHRTLLTADPVGDPDGLVLTASHNESDVVLRTLMDGAAIGRRVYIGSSLKFCHLAEGLADVYPRSVPCMEWDTAAGHAILLAAGGSIVDFAGVELSYGHPGFMTPAFIAYGRGYNS